MYTEKEPGKKNCEKNVSGTDFWAITRGGAASVYGEAIRTGDILYLYTGTDSAKKN
jgi:hypothetical protein